MTVRQVSSSSGVSIGSNILGGSSDRVLYIDSSGNLADSANFTFDGLDLYIGDPASRLALFSDSSNLVQFNNGAHDHDFIVTTSNYDSLFIDGGADSVIIGGSSTDLSSALGVQPTTTTDIGVVVRGLAAQSADLQQWQISTGVAKTLVDETGLLTAEWNGIANTSTDGLVLQNTTDAVVGAQNQYSPRLRLHGEVWSTTASASQTTDWAIENQSTPGSSNTVGGLFVLKHSANGAAYGNYITVRSNLNGTTGVYSFSASNVTNTSGTPLYFSITPTYNQSSTGGGTDLYVNRTENALGSGTHRILDLAVAGTSRLNVTNHGNLNIIPRSLTTGTAATGLLYTGPGHSTLSSLAEFNDVYLNITNTTSFGGTGTLADNRSIRIGKRTYGSSSAVTVTNAVTLDIEGAPDTAGSCVITNAYGIYVRGAALDSGVTNGVSLRVDPPSAAATVNAAAYFAGDVGIMTSIPSAFLHLGAGTATAGDAPLKFTSGTNLTAAEAGAVEYNGRFFLTDTDTTRRHIVQAAASTKTTAGAPYTNDGYVTMTINGTDVKVMTTA